ncbi:hypothetical protein GCM10010532_109490 [Dactylosporangium siamense]|uniref:Uncharacterized protein n=1 Tax=Dactylosporangium siamense TaxID=685454 RepID=A0A919PWY9_9ACTN|nr:hypothetical protein Dsi01nite_103460 [Dactylosporangium siamense]
MHLRALTDLVPTGPVTRQQPRRDQPDPESHRRRTGRGVLGHAGVRHQHPCVRLVPLRVPVQDAHVVDEADGAQPADGVVGDGQEGERQPDPGVARRRPDVVRPVQADRGEQRRLVQGRSDGRPAAGDDGTAVDLVDGDRDQAGTALLHHFRVLDQAVPAKGDGAADARVPGERQLRAGREDPDPVGGLGHRRRYHEDRLGEVELAGDRLHLLTGEIPGVEHDGEGVAGEGAIGEHVDDLVPQHHAPSVCERGGPGAVQPRAGGLLQ